MPCHAMPAPSVVSSRDDDVAEFSDWPTEWLTPPPLPFNIMASIDLGLILYGLIPIAFAFAFAFTCCCSMCVCVLLYYLYAYCTTVRTNFFLLWSGGSLLWECASSFFIHLRGDRAQQRALVLGKHETKTLHDDDISKPTYVYACCPKTAYNKLPNRPELIRIIPISLVWEASTVHEK